MNADNPLMQRLESDLVRIMRGPTFYPLSPEPLAPIDSPDPAPAVFFSEDAS